MSRFGIALVLCLAACQKHEAPPSQNATPAPVLAGGGGSVTQQSAEELATPLAKVGDVTITVGELEDQLDRQSPYIKARYTSVEQKRQFLDSLIRFEVLAQEAQKRGLDKDPEVVRTMKSVMVEKLMQDEFDANPPPVSDQELKQYYDTNQGEYVKPEEIRASAIVVKNKTAAAKIATEAQGDAGKTNTGFRALVDKYSTDDKTKLRGGDLRYFPHDSGDPDAEMPPKPVVDAAFALSGVGAVSNAIDAGDGTFWVLKETGHRRAVTKSFDDVKEMIRTKLTRDKRLAAQDAFVDNLKSNAKIDVLEDNLSKVRIDMKTQEAASPSDTTSPPAPPPNP